MRTLTTPVLLSLECRCARFMSDVTTYWNRARTNYFYARALIGRDFAVPTVLPAGH